MNQKQKNVNGITLIEVLVTVTIMTFIGLGLVALQFILNQNKILAINTYKSVDEANNITSNFIKEIRAARSGDNGAYVFENTDDTQIIFYSDIDFDNQTERVRYTFNGTTLTKGVTKPTGYPIQYPSSDEKLTVLSENIRNGSTPMFYYYNEDWPNDQTHNPLIASSRLSDTRIVKIYLRVNNNSAAVDKDYILESFAQIRMLKNNL